MDKPRLFPVELYRPSAPNADGSLYLWSVPGLAPPGQTLLVQVLRLSGGHEGPSQCCRLPTGGNKLRRRRSNKRCATSCLRNPNASGTAEYLRLGFVDMQDECDKHHLLRCLRLQHSAPILSCSCEPRDCLALWCAYEQQHHCLPLCAHVVNFCRGLACLPCRQALTLSDRRRSRNWGRMGRMAMVCSMQRRCKGKRWV